MEADAASYRAFADLAMPALLRGARGSYGNAVRAGLAAAGFDDLPRNAAAVLTGDFSHTGAAADLVRELGISKQAASQLIDTLVLRGYLTRQVDPADRRRQTVAVTERGQAAAEAIVAAADRVDEQLAELITAEELAGMRAGLAALRAIRYGAAATGQQDADHPHPHSHPHPDSHPH